MRAKRRRCRTVGAAAPSRSDGQSRVLRPRPVTDRAVLAEAHAPGVAAAEVSFGVVAETARVGLGTQNGRQQRAERGRVRRRSRGDVRSWIVDNRSLADKPTPKPRTLVE